MPERRPAPGEAWAPLPEDLLARLTSGRDDDPVRHVRRSPGRAARTVEWPTWVAPPLRETLEGRGVRRPWAHQVQAAELAWAGRSVVVATGTASGKSLAYQLPLLTTLAGDDRATALYLSPTKALGHDQLGAARSLAPGDVRPAAYDGDTARGDRDWVRAHSRWIFTNPDMLHRGILPAHPRWSAFLRRLRFVVVDECHTYRGVFGSHVALVLRRLRRICRHYGTEPTFVLASATAGDPAGSASRLTGVEVTAVDLDGSPAPPSTFALWEPPFGPLRGEHGAPVRRSALTETSSLLADLVVSGARTLAFVRSRRAAELVALRARRLVAEAGSPELARSVVSYRAGYLGEERRRLESGLRSGTLRGVAATNALELGIDVSGLDAVVISGFPGTISSLRQQAGRAGRGDRPALAIFVARDDPLDTYLVNHPDAVFGRPVEAAVCHPGNPYVLRPQLCAAAADLAVAEADVEVLGGPVARTELDGLVSDGLLRRRPRGWFWTAARPPDVDIRGSGQPVSIVVGATGQLLGVVDGGAAHSTVHPGAVYLHQGVSFVVDGLDLDAAVASVHAEDPPWTTTARDITELEIVAAERTVDWGPVRLHTGVVDVGHQVVSYLRRRSGTGEILDENPLDLPARRLRTRAVWYVLDDDTLHAALRAVGRHVADVPGSLHAAEHAAIGLLPLFASCDRWDIGGVSTARHADTGRPTVVVYDGHPGGAGFAEHGFAVAREWLAATRAAVAACACRDGCPSCVQSPKCGNGNNPLDKRGAIAVLDLVLGAAALADGG